MIAYRQIHQYKSQYTYKYTHHRNTPTLTKNVLNNKIFVCVWYVCKMSKNGFIFRFIIFHEHSIFGFGRNKMMKIAYLD